MATTIKFEAGSVEYTAEAIEELRPCISLRNTRRSDGTPANNPGILLGLFPKRIRTALAAAESRKEVSRKAFAIELQDAVDLCGFQPGLYTHKEKELREFARAGAAAFGVPCDSWTLVGNWFVASVPLSGCESISFREVRVCQ